MQQDDGLTSAESATSARPDQPSVTYSAATLEEEAERARQRASSVEGWLSDEDFSRTYIHPELGTFPLYDALALYAWHGRHHAAHIANAIRTM